MPETASDTAVRPVNNRAKVSNGTKILAGVDGRSTTARRYRDLVADFATEVAGDGAMLFSPSEQTVLRQAAALALQAEQLQAALVRGEKVDPALQVRLANGAQRLLRAVRAKRRERANATAGSGLLKAVRAARRARARRERAVRKRIEAAKAGAPA